MIQLEEAVLRILASVTPLGSEVLPLGDISGRVLAEDAFSRGALPAFDNTAMDGYALRSTDVMGASAMRPALLRVIGRIGAGEVFSRTVSEGTAVRVFTGSPIPQGADAVVMQEETRTCADRPGVVEILDAAPAGQFIRKRGDDVQPGARICRAGTRLGAGHLGLLAAGGLGEVRVARSPSVALLATGSELVEPGQPLGPGQIHDSNRVMLAAWAARTGARVGIRPLVPDTLEETRDALAAAFECHDVVVTSGGVSVGDTDFIKPAFEALGGRIELWKVALKPGKPFVFGRLNGRLLFGLPGNPASSAVTFLLLVRPALIRLQGGLDTALPSHTGVLAEPLSNPGDRRHIMRVSVDGCGRVRSAGLQGSHAVGSLAEAQGLVDVPPGVVLPEGTGVTVLRID